MLHTLEDFGYKACPSKQTGRQNARVLLLRGKLRMHLSVKEKTCSEQESIARSKRVTKDVFMRRI
jgi:hypothetical protein